MRRWIHWCLLLLLLAGSAPRLLAQQDQDTLTESEIEQIRENAVHPVDRIKLYMKFIDQRVDDIKKLAADPALTHQKAQLRSKLEEFTRLCDELQDNLDTYDAAHADLRKALKDLAPDSGKWPDVLNRVGTDATYDFSRKTALAASQSVNDEVKQLLAEQDKYFADHKDERGKNGSGPN
ncbi:hypothetical protein [Paracidobacterium acidisoli]|uniref:Uncharacterized protein n=1 Tax=Paracidobacterium acidisoli TaxID=2303751 RepID=A0A372IT04_9BACT|nr:hypothetical protein [Paracidobacterium acidisoli]MBT9329474.1 hypothetical protein [Paracidobacterium acidisoli]